MVGSNRVVVAGLAEWARRMRRLGHDVVEVPGWQTRGQGDLGIVEGLTEHHTASPPSGPATALRVVTFGRSDLRGLLSQIYSSREWRGRRPSAYLCGSGVAWHAGRSAWAGDTHLNFRYLGWEHENVGTPAEPWTAAELDLSAAGAIELGDVFGFDARVVAEHYEVARPRGRKSDRHSIDGPAWRRRVARGHPPAPTTPEVSDMLPFHPHPLPDMARDFQRRLRGLLEHAEPDQITAALHGATLTADGWVGGTWQPTGLHAHTLPDGRQVHEFVVDGRLGSVTWTAWVGLGGRHLDLGHLRANAPRDELAVTAEEQLRLLDRLRRVELDDALIAAITPVVDRLDDLTVRVDALADTTSG